MFETKLTNLTNGYATNAMTKAVPMNLISYLSMVASLLLALSYVGNLTGAAQISMIAF